MRRREFIVGLGSAPAWPVVTQAQQAARGIRRIGVLTAYPEDEPEIKVRLNGFRQGLERLAWTEGRNIRIDYRYAPGGVEAALLRAKELLALQPEVILAHSITTVEALRRERSTIPIVFVGIMDPVAQGLVSSLARPGGSVTGFTQFEVGVAGKWLAMLKEIAPGLRHIALVGDRSSDISEYFMREAVAAARSLAIEVAPIYVENADDIERSLETFAHVPNGGLVLLPTIPNSHYRDVIISLAARLQLPAVYTASYYVDEGGLMSYGIDRVDEFRQAASYVDRILRGEKPGDLPVQVPVKYETALNLKTAKAIGLTVPDLMIVRADKVIE
jgi:ABC-type uncharacterized transport system substrate-binding protein